MKFEWLTAPVAAVLVAALGVACIVLVGVPVWLVARGYAPPALLVAPIGAILTGITTWVVGYTRGLMKMPPAPPGTAFQLVSVPPPPTAAQLAGDDLYGDAPAVAMSQPEAADLPMTTTTTTTPATPDAIRRTLR